MSSDLNLNRAVQDLWDENAEWWDARVGEGNEFHKTLVEPAVDRLLAPRAGGRILEIACGNGQYARHLASLGVVVTATDFSARFLERARARPTPGPGSIEYRQVDATDESALLALGEGRFDAAVSNMALMDMAQIEPLFAALPRLLVPGGRFVFATMHPCFNNPDGTYLVHEERDEAGELVDTYAVKVERYLTPTVARGLGIVGQPAPHYYFHRPLVALLAPAFAAGLVVDAVEEPAFGPEATSSRSLSWANFTEVPPVMVVRLRVAGG